MFNIHNVTILTCIDFSLRRKMPRKFLRKSWPNSLAKESFIPQHTEMEWMSKNFPNYIVMYLTIQYKRKKYFLRVNYIRTISTKKMNLRFLKWPFLELFLWYFKSKSYPFCQKTLTFFQRKVFRKKSSWNFSKWK